MQKKYAKNMKKICKVNKIEKQLKDNMYII